MIRHYVVNKTDRFAIRYDALPDGTIALYAVERPRDPFGGPVTTTHVYNDDRICVATGHEPRTYDRAKAIAAAWMEGYSSYVRTGTFPNKARHINV